MTHRLPESAWNLPDDWRRRVARVRNGAGIAAVKKALGCQSAFVWSYWLREHDDLVEAVRPKRRAKDTRRYGQPGSIHP